MKKLLLVVLFTIPVLAQYNEDVLIYNSGDMISFFDVEHRVHYEEALAAGPTVNDIVVIGDYLLIVNSGVWGAGGTLQILPMRAVYKLLQNGDPEPLAAALRTVPLLENGNPWSVIGISSDEVLVSLPQAGALQTVDCATGRITATINGINGGPQEMTQLPGGEILIALADWSYAGLPAGAGYAVFDPATMEVVSEIPSRLNAVSVTSINDSTVVGLTWGAWFGEENYGSVDLIDPMKKEIVASIDLEGGRKAEHVVPLPGERVHLTGFDQMFATFYGHLSLADTSITYDTAGVYAAPFRGHISGMPFSVEYAAPMKIYNSSLAVVDSFAVSPTGAFALAEFSMEVKNANPQIISIEDVPFDQGGYVVVEWMPSGNDAYYSGDRVTSYGVWRVKPEEILFPPANGSATLEDIENTMIFLGEVPAVPHFATYGFEAATESDSNDTGLNMNAFVITAHTADPDVYFYSEQYIGYSVDNIAPSTPGNPAAEFNYSDIRIHWESVDAPDLRHYIVYRGRMKDFTPSKADMFWAVTDTMFVDSYILNGDYYYRISAVDVNGNESEYSDETGPIVVGVQDEAALPQEYELYANYPNPFNPSTTIKYALPDAAKVTITIYNAAGELVAAPVNTHRAAGYHTAVWNAAGLSSGLYLYRLSAKGEDGSSFADTGKMMLLK